MAPQYEYLIVPLIITSAYFYIRCIRILAQIDYYTRNKDIYDKHFRDMIFWTGLIVTVTVWALYRQYR